MACYIKTLSFLLLSTSYSTSLNVECEFKTDLTWGYGCMTSFNNVTYICELDDVVGELAPGKTLDDVKFISIKSRTLKYMPKGLDKKFRNLETLNISIIHLKQITREDLEPFGGKLKRLLIPRSSLESIDGDLFVSTPNVTIFQIDSKHMENINENVFEPIINNLETLMINCQCLAINNQDNDNQITEMIEQIKKRCYHADYDPQKSTKICEEISTKKRGMEESGHFVAFIGITLGVIGFLFVVGVIYLCCKKLKNTPQDEDQQNKTQEEIELN